MVDAHEIMNLFKQSSFKQLANFMSYIPPIRNTRTISDDPKSEEYQRYHWEKLKKSLNGQINKLNSKNITEIVPEIIQLNLVRGAGIFCRSIMKSQQLSSLFTSVYCCCVAILNTKFPSLGELLVQRLVDQFKKSFRRQQKQLCMDTTTFLAHLTNQFVVHELLILQILFLLLENPTDDSIELAVNLTKQVGQHLLDSSPKALNAVFDRLRGLLHNTEIHLRTQYMVEVLFQIRKDGFKDYPQIRDELDLVEEDDQVTHSVTLEDKLDTQELLNVFKYDENYVGNEMKYDQIRTEILGEPTSDEESENLSEPEQAEVEVIDKSGKDLIDLRKRVYLTLKSSLSFEECTHKLIKLNIPEKFKPELPIMLLDCCGDERTFNNFYALIGERLCRLNPYWTEVFENYFATLWDSVDDKETGTIRNIGSFYSHLLVTKAIKMTIFKIVYLSERKTTSSSRILLKFILQEMSTVLGQSKMKDLFFAEDNLENLKGIFAKKRVSDARFAVNYLTSIKLGYLTDDLRLWIKGEDSEGPPSKKIKN
eukprot:NODE_13_length_54415_cov_0.522424.p7 type:complete len:537 gc:universal NODE_13_length_54415_cov_0.522424:22886-24496(+)